MNKKIFIISGSACAAIVIALASFFVWSVFIQKQQKKIIIESWPIPPHATSSIMITLPVQNEFATYTPSLSTVTPSAKSYTFPVDLNIIANKDAYNVRDKGKELLEKQGFVAMSAYFESMSDAYQNDETGQHPNFVTTDSVLHTFHILYDFSLRHIELNALIPDLKQLTTALLDEAVSEYDSTQNSSVKEATKNIVAYLAVAQKLLEPSYNPPSFVADNVSKEIALISWHNRISPSPIFGYEEDYTQYVPRGHYTRNEEFQAYFRAMMWYGRMQFRVQPPEQKEKAREATRQALLLVSLLANTRVGDQAATTIWRNIYEPTVFFVGKSDDATVLDYLPIANKVFGEQISATNLADDQKIDQFIEEVQKLPFPKIISSIVSDKQDASVATKAFRFMGQRFIPDSYVLGNLVYSQITKYTGQEPLPFTASKSEAGTVRGFPRGLDVATVLGSQRAHAILDYENDSKYINYEETVQKLKNEFQSLPSQQWSENLYWNWLYALLPTLTIKASGYPIFMQQQSWLDKDLNSFLGSWTELRHDTILYAKQSYTVEATSAGPGGEILEPPKKDRGYVEPNPEVFARLAPLAKYMSDGLDARHLISDEYKEKLKGMEALNLQLKSIAEKELTNTPLSSEDYRYIREIGTTLSSLVYFSQDEREKIASGADEKIDIVADVHTDGNTGQVLEEGIGKPLQLLVVVKNGNELYYASGPLFSYYEFKQPMNDRLTDEKWQEMEKPPLPVFTHSFIEEEKSR